MADKRKQTQDSLSQFFSGEGGSTGAEADSDERPQDAPQQAKSGGEGVSTEKETKTATAAAERQDMPKRNATFYLSEEVLSALEEGWFQLRQMAGPDQKGSVSKSAIVEAALRDALKELESEGEGGRVAQELLGKRK